MKHRKICESVYVIGGIRRSHPFDCAVYAVTGDGGTVLVDCGSPFGFEYKERHLREIGTDISKVELLIGTHCHYDHVGGAAELKRRAPGARLAMHAGAVAAVEAADPEATCAGWMFREELEPAGVDEVVEEGDVITGAGIDFEVISLPGHSPGSIGLMARIGGNRVLFTGDAYVPSCERVGYDYDSLVETYGRLIELDADYVCPGHMGHLVSFPVTQAVMRNVPEKLARAVVDLAPLTKTLTSVASFFYENTTSFRWLVDLEKKA